MIVLVTGGQRSGKSAFAESLLKDKSSLCYIATSRPLDEEMKERVRLHQKSRPDSWSTREENYALSSLVGEEDAYMLECVGTLVSNILYDRTKDLEKIPPEIARKTEEIIYSELSGLIKAVRENKKDLVIVTNEVGLSLSPMNHLARVYTDMLGKINQRLAKEADQAYLVVAGLEMRLK